MSEVANEKKHWLNQVKADAIALTKQRLEADLPRVEKEAKERTEEDLEPSQPVVSDGQPDQGAIDPPEPKKGKK